MKLPGLREWRELRGYTQRELAKTVGTSQDTISKLETGARGCRPSTAQRLAQALQVEVAELAKPRAVLLKGSVEGAGTYEGSLEAGEPPEERREFALSGTAAGRSFARGELTVTVSVPLTLRWNVAEALKSGKRLDPDELRELEEAARAQLTAEQPVTEMSAPKYAKTEQMQ
jgi:transcriptional regulator with XRE-family HTH domain